MATETASPAQEGTGREPRPEKVAVVAQVRDRLSGADAAILTEYRGLTVKDLATLRRSLRESGGDYKIYKNTLVRFAVRELGLTDLEPMLEGPTAIAFVDGDAVGVAKALRDFGRTHPALVVKGGILGESILTATDAGALADIPPREVLLARLAGGLAAPMVQFAGLLQALPRNFAYGLKALIDQGGTGVVDTSSPQPEAASESAPAETGDAPVAESQSAEPAGDPPPEGIEAPQPDLTEPAAEAAGADTATAAETAPEPSTEATREAPADTETTETTETTTTSAETTEEQ